jgi:DNA polymerase I-like protein with 3'-5' exonuclease and polymerase domains
MAMLNPYLEDLRQTRKILEHFNCFDLPIGKDGRCRGKYAPWVQLTSRSSPGKGSIFAMPAWVRWLIKPPEGRGVAYVDLKSAEFGIGAALSHDPNMMQDYTDMVEGRIECVYFELARRSRQVPDDAVVADNKPIRKLWKTASLAMMYGQSPEGLSAATGIPLSSARVIQDAFKRRYSLFWSWIRREIVHAHCLGKIETVCGWRLNVNQMTFDGETLTKDGTLQNFHPQATCADIMRRAVTLMADRGIAICEIVHDAVMVEDSTEALEATAQSARDCWRQASLDILGFELDADAKRCTSPNRYEDEDGRAMWGTLMGLLEKAEKAHRAAAA